LLNTLSDLRLLGTGLAYAGEIAFHIRCENRHADAAKAFSQNLERYGLPRTRRPGDETVTVAHARKEDEIVIRLRNDDWISHDNVGLPPVALGMPIAGRCSLKE
jgi:hypothetical protein